MSATRVYVGEPGGENLDVLRQNTNEETKGKARFEKGDVISVPKELAERLDASWATEAKAAKQEEKTDETEDVSDAPGGDN